MRQRRFYNSAGRLVALSCVALLAAACAENGEDVDPASDGEGEGESISLTLGAGHPAGGAISYTNYAQDFFVPEVTERVESETPHTIDIQEAYGGSIADLDEVLDATGTGLLDVGVVPYPFEPSALFLHNASYYVPFGSPDLDVVIRTLRQTMEEVPYLVDMFEEEHNQKMLGLGGVGDYGLLTTFEWETVDELEGVNVTAAGPNLPWLEPVGATPVQGSLNEWYTGLQTGVYDGVIVFPEAVEGFGLYEVAPVFTETGFGAVAVGSININLDTWASLPDSVQEIIQEVALEYEETFAEMDDAAIEEALAQMEEDGATLEELPEEQRVEWAEELPNIPGQQAQEADDMGLPGTEVMSTYLRIMEEEGYEFPREWEIE